jgi:membrane fusion protein (multidrug efflux system)
VGDYVEKGQVLVEFRKTDLEADIQAAEAAYSEASNNYERFSKLFDEGVISPENLDQYRTAMESAAAALSAARSRLAFAEARSPIDGVVEQRMVEPGEYKDHGKELLVIVDLGTVEVRALVPEQEVRILSLGQKGEFQVEASDEWIEGTVSRISPSTGDPNRFFDVYLDVENCPTEEGWLLRPGMFAEVRFVRRTVRDALAVPDRAVVQNGGVRAVFVARPGVEEMPVERSAQNDPSGGFVARLGRGAAKLRGASPSSDAKARGPVEERQVHRAVRVEVVTGLREGETVQLVEAPISESDLVVLGPRDDMRDGALLKVVGGER